MPCSRVFRPVALAAVLLLNAQAAWSLGWARSQQGAVLGQPLNFVAALRLDPGDEVDPACVSAEVSLGDHRLSPAQVRLNVDSSQRDALVMRVSSAVVVDEPVVAVTLAIGCPARMSRRFVLLADPPDLVQPVALPPAALAQAEALAAAPATAVAATAATPPARLATAPAPVSAPKAPPPPPVAKPAAASTARPAEPATPRPPVKAAAKPPAKPAAAAPTTSAAAPAAGRLKLDLTEPLPKTANSATATATAASAVAAALEAVADAASAARAAASAASQAQARVASMEKQVAALQFEAQQSRDIAAQMRSRLTSAEGAAKWLLPLSLALVALAGLAGWLAWKLRQLQAARQASWRQAAVADAEVQRPPVATSQLPLVTSEIMAPSTVPGAGGLVGLRPLGLDDAPAAPVQPLADDAPAAVPAAPSSARGYAPYPHLGGAPAAAESPMERTLVLPPQPVAPSAATQATAAAKGAGTESARDVSIEELLDLEQQAEFFIVLGQEEAAIDLLVDHLRDTGGGSPLPYLKLLEIYRRRGDREAYERTRTRFNHRFNAYAPDWDTDLSHGRSLEDYAGVLPRLQQVWPKPLDAMAELEALLFRKSRGELFDLPAYREVLFLYALARDLLDRAPAESGSVDLLLPLADPHAPGATPSTPANPYFGLERDSVFDMLREDRPTAPVDLDLTQPEMPVSILDPLSPRKLR